MARGLPTQTAGFLSKTARRYLLNLLAVALAVGALAGVGFTFRQAWRPPEGSSERDEVTLVCLKCGKETTVASQAYAKLSVDPETSAKQCPKCGALQAYVASLRCPRCQRAIARTPQSFGTAFVCPYCQAPLGAGAPTP